MKTHQNYESTKEVTVCSTGLITFFYSMFLVNCLLIVVCTKKCKENCILLSNNTIQKYQPMTRKPTLPPVQSLPAMPAWPTFVQAPVVRDPSRPVLVAPLYWVVSIHTPCASPSSSCSPSFDSFLLSGFIRRNLGKWLSCLENCFLAQ